MKVGKSYKSNPNTVAKKIMRTKSNSELDGASILAEWWKAEMKRSSQWSFVELRRISRPIRHTELGSVRLISACTVDFLFIPMRDQTSVRWIGPRLCPMIAQPLTSSKRAPILLYQGSAKTGRNLSFSLTAEIISKGTSLSASISS